MRAFVVMGVSGCGKTTVARALAEKTGGLYLDADDFHPPTNKKKMAAGVPLTDEDRWGWLDSLNAALKAEAGRPVFLACSALKQVYRDRLSDGVAGLRVLYLKGSKECIRKRLELRKSHFMPPALLDSQFAILEEPADAVVLDVEKTPAEVVREALRSVGFGVGS
jgi:gluconokinase